MFPDDDNLDHAALGLCQFQQYYLPVFRYFLANPFLSQMIPRRAPRLKVIRCGDEEIEVSFYFVNAILRLRRQCPTKCYVNTVPCSIIP